MGTGTTERSFDELARGLASGKLSRGKALRLMGAALVGGTLASVPGIALAAPKPRPDGRKCKANSQCQSGNCSGGTCAAACVSDGDPCNSPGQCCSAYCSEGGTCGAPPPAVNSIGCLCADVQEPSTCSPVSCFDDGQVAEVCNALCAQTGSVPVASGCSPGAC